MFKGILQIFIILFLVSCSNPNESKDEVVVYVSVDQVFSSKILKQYEKETGVKVKAVFDTEASKAVGLEKRLLAEKDTPRADVFWNSEFLRTARLTKAGVLEEAEAMGIRSRVLIVNTKLVKEEDYPSSLMDLLDPKWKGKLAICNPYLGTASTHFAALYHEWGERKFIEFLDALKRNEPAILAGNSVVKDVVGNGQYAFGLVDTDDALVGIEEGLPIKMIYYDQAMKGMFSIHQTISQVKGAKHPESAKKLIAYLHTPRIEQQLIKMHAVQFPMLNSEKDTLVPRLWTLPGDEIFHALDPSAVLMRAYLD